MGGVHLGPKEDRAQDIKMITKAVHEHEKNMHGGKKETRLHFASGGMAGNRLDQKPRGGGGKKHHGTQVNVVVAGQRPQPPMGAPGPGAMPMPVRPPMAAPPPAAAAPPAAMPPRSMGPPMGGVPGGMPPGGMPGGMPPRPMIKTGGRPKGKGGVGEPAMTAGAGSGPGRIQKVRREGLPIPD